MNTDLKKRPKILYLVFSLLLISLTGYWFYNSSVIITILSSFFFSWSVLVFVSVLELFVQIKLPEKYYIVRNVEINIQMYERVGIKFFKTKIRRGFLHKLAPHIEISTKEDITKNLELDMKRAETIHLFSLLIIVFLSLTSVLFLGKNFEGMMLFLFGISINVYPIMLQRYNRSRLKRIKKML
jgi:hypothetical protein